MIALDSYALDLLREKVDDETELYDAVLSFDEGLGSLGMFAQVEALSASMAAFRASFLLTEALIRAGLINTLDVIETLHAEAYTDDPSILTMWEAAT